MPLGFQARRPSGSTAWEPSTTIEAHLQALKLAGAARTAIIVSESKLDIVRYLGSGRRYDLPVAYLFQQQLRGMPFALDLAAPWAGEATVLFSMPDTIVTPVDTMAQLVAHHQRNPADVTLGLFRTTTPHKFGMVGLDVNGDVVGFVDKPAQTELTLMWGLAVWAPSFTRFLAASVAAATPGDSEMVLSDLFLAALNERLQIQALVLEGARYHDIGTPEDFQAGVAELAAQTSQSWL